MRCSALAPSLSLIAPCTSPVAAQTLMQRLACTGDAMRLCSEFVPNHKLVANCMELKHDQLGPRCRAVFDAGMEDLRAQGRRVP